jgi:hypothetical protein
MKRVVDQCARCVKFYLNTCDGLDEQFKFCVHCDRVENHCFYCLGEGVMYGRTCCFCEGTGEKGMLIFEDYTEFITWYEKQKSDTDLRIQIGKVEYASVKEALKE